MARPYRPNGHCFSVVPQQAVLWCVLSRLHLHISSFLHTFPHLPGLSSGSAAQPHPRKAHPSSSFHRWSCKNPPEETGVARGRRSRSSYDDSDGNFFLFGAWAARAVEICEMESSSCATRAIVWRGGGGGCAPLMGCDLPIVLVVIWVDIDLQLVDKAFQATFQIQMKVGCKLASIMK